MKGKLMFIVFMAFALAFVIAAPSSYAFEGYGKDRHDCGCGKMISDKTYTILENKEELGLSDEQVVKIKDLEMKSMKDSIRREAEIKVLALDIKADMTKEPVDMAAVNVLIDKKYELKKEGTKASVATCVALKGILTKEQDEKLKELWKKCSKEKMEDHGREARPWRPVVGDREKM